ncbi:MAG: hypothetical protein FWC73_03465, partial [Defluviitaleaceae bacterium]|nr:hypothetical protein [Defluviitaleaceae bacterium]
VRFAKNNADEAKIYAEGVLFHALLNGATPVFSLPQIFDSSFVLSMGENNNFIESFRRGYLRVALYGEVNSIKRYMLNVLRNNIKQKKVNFRFSSMPFLNEYDDIILKEVYKDMIIAIESDEPFKNNIISIEHTEVVDRFLRCISNINLAIQSGNNGDGCFLSAGTPKFILKDVIVQNIEISKSKLAIKSQDIDDRIQNEFIEICDRLLRLHKITKDLRYSSRTKNYEIIEGYSAYSPESVAAVKALIDYCYNVVVASSIPKNNEKDILGISKDYPFLINAAESFPTTFSYDDPKMFSCDTKNTPLTWEMLNTITDEIISIQNEKGLSWADARRKYESRQTWLPFRSMAHSGAVTMALFVPSAMLGRLPIGLAIGLVIDFASGQLSEVMDDKLKKPSIVDVFRSFKSSNEKNKILKLYSVDTAFFIDS